MPTVGRRPDRSDPADSPRCAGTRAHWVRIYTERQLDIQPAEHLTVVDPEAVTIEPWVCARFHERGADGAESTRGTVVGWEPPARVAITWRIGPDWRPAPDDDHASVLVVTFAAAGPNVTEVVITYTELERHGDMAPMLRAAIEDPGPVSAVKRYVDLVRRHATAA